MVTYEFDINILSFADDFQVYRLVAIDHERIRLSSYKMNKKKKFAQVELVQIVQIWSIYALTIERNLDKSIIGNKNEKKEKACLVGKLY